MTKTENLPPRPVRAFQWDLARQVERLDFLLKWLPRYAEWGYEELYLHLEDAVEFPSLPGVARRDAYSQKQFARLVEAATHVGIRVVPIVNLLGHTQYLIKTPGLRDLNELRAPDGSPLERGQICPLHPRTLEVAEKLLRDIAPFCTAGLVHTGLDESFHIGKCPRCREEIARVGLAAHFAGHVSRLHALTRGLGLRMALWADMFYYIPEAIAQLPRDVVAFEWYYYPFTRQPRVELFNFAEANLAARFKQHGIAFYGCPMNGAFRWEPLPVFRERLENIRSWWRYGQRTGAAGFLVTSWEPNRLAIELTTAIDAAAACLWTHPEIHGPEKMLEVGCARVFGRAGKAAARTVLAADKFPFSGYARWQINDRWDVLATREPPASCAREESALRALAKSAVRLPPALGASLQFRHYLAQRDRFVRSAAQSVFLARRHLARGKMPPAAKVLAQTGREAAQLEQELKKARRAARIMWRRSRDPKQHGPNEEMLTRDGQRLRALRAWLKRTQKNPALAQGATPVCGQWQLQFTVHNFAPALQKIVIEQQRTNGLWEELHSVFTIEFKAAAAQPRSKIAREISVPVDTTDARLRIAVRGLGQVAISGIALTDGVSARSPVGARKKIILGQPAPRSGFPAIDWARNCGEIELNLAPVSSTDL
ncbi:MAG TPA: family 20 glycosylhydrolase [Opitutaceae bacterium]|nr:family 20 glycosylhydrolase [Opitutaceae bacterium]